jgi:hypothetical protein
MNDGQDSGADLIDRIMDEASIPIVARSRFREVFGEAVDRAHRELQHEAERPNRRKSIEKQLHRVALKAEALRKILADLDEDAQFHLGIYAQRQQWFGTPKDAEELRFQIMDLVLGEGRARNTIVLASLTKVIVDIKHAAETEEWPSGPKGGAPDKSNPMNPERFSTYDQFVFDLVRLVQSFGQRPTFDKDIGSGSLAVLLKICTCLFPAGFIPLDGAGDLEGLTRIKAVKDLAESVNKLSLSA